MAEVSEELRAQAEAAKAEANAAFKGAAHALPPPPPPAAPSPRLAARPFAWRRRPGP